jgi:hypothetical protein
MGNKEDLISLAPANKGIIIIAPEALVAFFKKDRRCWLFEFMQQFKQYFAEEITIQKKYATEKSVAYLYKSD